ncbi:MAG: hypothetical protein JKY93_08795 [Gammaproteobacteria bacterium]|nr:hypothetical protein [Gammaproteobacteria bacterium]
MSYCKTISQGMGFASVLLAFFMSFAAHSAEENLVFDAEAVFKQAMEDRDAGNYFKSIEAFQSILSNQPRLHRARLELAVTYFRNLSYKEALQQAALVIKDPKTPPNVRATVLAFAAQVKNDMDKFKKKGGEVKWDAALGFMTDSNVNVGPDNADLGGNLTLASGSLEKSDEAILLSVALNHVYNTGKKLQFGQKQASLTWQSKASLYRRQYLNFSDFDLTVLSGSTGPGFLSFGNWRANIDVRGDLIYLKNDKLASFWSVAPSVSWSSKNKTAEITWDGSVMEKRFSRPIDQGRDSKVLSGGVAFGMIMAKGKIATQVGINVFDERAVDNQYQNHGHVYFVAASWKVFKDSVFFAKFSNKKYDYDGVVPVFNVARNDTERRYNMGYNIALSGETFKDWNLRIEAALTENKSNVLLYDYDRSQTSFTLSRSF